MKLTSLIDTNKCLAFQCIIIASGGKDINRIVNYLKKYTNRPITVSLFPGIVVEEQLDAYITRLKVDLVLLNSKKDEKYYAKICKIFKRPYNGFLYGASWFSNIQKETSKMENIIVFFEQINVPETINERKLLAEKLIDLAKKNPDHTLYIKPREEFINNENSIVSIFKEMTLPSNTIIVHNNINDLINVMKLGITISSSVTIEALLNNKKMLLINDFKSKKYYIYYYKESNLLVNISDINVNNIPKVNVNWVNENIENPYNNIDELVECIKSAKKEIFNFKENKIIFQMKICISFFTLYLYNPLYMLKSINNSFKVLSTK